MEIKTTVADFWKIEMGHQTRKQDQKREKWLLEVARRNHHHQRVIIICFRKDSLRRNSSYNLWKTDFQICRVVAAKTVMPNHQPVLINLRTRSITTQNTNMAVKPLDQVILTNTKTKKLISKMTINHLKLVWNKKN